MGTWGRILFLTLEVWTSLSYGKSTVGTQGHALLIRISLFDKGWSSLHKGLTEVSGKGQALHPNSFSRPYFNFSFEKQEKWTGEIEGWRTGHQLNSCCNLSSNRREGQINSHRKEKRKAWTDIPMAIHTWKHAQLVSLILFHYCLQFCSYWAVMVSSATWEKHSNTAF